MIVLLGAYGSKAQMVIPPGVGGAEAPMVR